MPSSVLSNATSTSPSSASTQTVVNTLADVSLAYWDLVYARAAVGVQRQALALAEQLVADNRARVAVGTMAPIDVVAAQSEAAARRQLLALAVETQRTSELALKELIVGGMSDELWDAEINPTDQPRIEATPIELREAIRGALDRRTDVSRARRQLDINQATVDNLRNSTLPALDLVGSYQLSGQGGPRLVPAGNSFEDIFGGAGGMIPGGYRDALDSIANADYPIWNVQLQMTWPLGRSADRAAYERARLELQQNRARIRRIELRIASEVTNAALRIQSIRERIDAATASRELAEQQLQAEESKFEVGLSTNFFVLQSQRDLAAAQDAELRAILDYQRALIEFDRTQRASLGAAGIAMVGGATGGGAVGAQRTTASSAAPFLSLQARSRRGVAVDGYQPQAGEDMEVNANIVSPGYLRLMGVPFVRGRDLEPGERDAVLVNQAFAQRFWSGQDAVGRRVGGSRRGLDPAWSTVVGVVEDGHFVSFADSAIPVVFWSTEDVYRPRMTFHLRGVTADAARRAIGELDPSVPVGTVVPMSDTVGTILLPARVAAVVSGLVGGAGLVLACIGLFGTLSYVVARRAPEIGLRVALGARPLQVIRLVAGGMSVKLVAAGVVLGAGLGSGLAPLLQSQFAGGEGVDLVTLAGVTACLALVASIGVGVPAARALRIHPAEVLRVEE